VVEVVLPVIVSVAPMVFPLESWIVTLWGVEDELSKSILSEPAFAVSDVCV